MDEATILAVLSKQALRALNGERRICYWGTFDLKPDCPRNSFIMNGLTENGVEVVLCHREIWKDSRDKVVATRNLLSTMAKYIRAWAWLVKRYKLTRDHDYIFVGYFGHLDIFPAKILSVLYGRPIVFDAFYSLAETMKDRGISQHGPKQYVARLIDRLAIRLSDIVLVDTEQHKQLFLSISPNQTKEIVVIPAGVDDKIFCAPENKKETDRIENWMNGEHQGGGAHFIKEQGIFDIVSLLSYLPLHGADIQIQAAKLLAGNSNVRFTFVGDGPEYRLVKSLAAGLNNVRFINGWFPLNVLKPILDWSDMSLGVFSLSEKTNNVIPYKAYMSLAAGKPLITSSTDATKEAGMPVIYCEPGNPDSLARAITSSLDHERLAQISEEGRAWFYKFGRGKEQVKKLISVLYRKDRMTL